MTPFPDGKFSIIYADPPWRYNFSKDNADRVENHYETMKLGDIQSLPVNELGEDDCVLYLWSTAPKLIEALSVMQAWGFQYKTNMAWDKEWIGMGYWFRGQHEHLLVGTKGKKSPPKPTERVSSVLRERRTQHSKKPDYIYEMLEKQFPDDKKIELFARNTRKGWTSWGDEV